MSNPKLDFQDSARRFAQMFSGLVNYAEEVGKVGSLEQAASEAEARIVKAQKDFDKQTEDLERQRKEHLGGVEQAKQYANSANLEASKILGIAKVEHDKIIEAAKAQANGIIAEGNLVLEADKRQLGIIKNEIEIHQGALERARADHIQAEHDLADMQLKKKQVVDEIAILKARL